MAHTRWSNSLWSISILFDYKPFKLRTLLCFAVQVSYNVMFWKRPVENTSNISTFHQTDSIALQNEQCKDLNCLLGFNVDAVASSDLKVHYQLHSNTLMNQPWQDPSIWRQWIMPMVQTLSLLPCPFYKCWLRKLGKIAAERRSFSFMVSA